MKAAFMTLDTSGDGNITASELGAALNSLGYVVTEEEVQTLIANADVDGMEFLVTVGRGVHCFGDSRILHMCHHIKMAPRIPLNFPSNLINDWSNRCIVSN